jgi:hypothetical protein
MTGRTAVAVLAALVLILPPAALAERTKVKPGWNLFSPQQDVEMGREVARDAERKLPMLNDRRVDDYLNNLGRRLAARAPGERYPYQFKAVNDASINAFALPGGFLYVHRGVIEAADNEAQLAGVMAHEIGHVALRHGTSQATKSYAAQVPLAILGGVLGSNSVGAVMAQLGAEFVTSSVLLKYSRDAERQADLIGTQILYDNNYDPRAMAQFFEKIEAEGKGGRAPQFLSSHPNPENRIGKVTQEVQNLGGLQSNYKSDSAEFQAIKRYVRSLPSAPRSLSQRSSGGSSGGSGRPGVPSERYQVLENNSFSMRHPDNWQAYGQGNSITIAPQGGIVDNGRGAGALGHGVIVSAAEPHNDRAAQITLEEATDQLVQDLRQSNPNMRVARRHERIRIGSERALSTMLTNESPLGGREYDWLVTVLRPEGLIYFVFVAPERDFDVYEDAFRAMLDSVRFKRT